ncbi:ABC transporter permease [bacterium]|nr:ABC transporter permease [bacterium]
MSSLLRIRYMILRYLYVHKRSVSRSLELVFWPVMELLVWGYLVLYIQRVGTGDLPKIIVSVFAAVIFWDLLYRSQQGVSLSFVEDIWTHNIFNLLISPLRLWEWITSTFIYGMMKTLIIVCILSVLALFLYHFHFIDTLGFYIIPFLANLLLFGWALGLFTSGLLLRWGHAVEALIWGIPFLVQPLSAIYYPVSVLPAWLQHVSWLLPSTYVFEGMRSVVATGQMDAVMLAKAFLCNVVYFVLGSFFFTFMYRLSQKSGRLGRLGMD